MSDSEEIVVNEAEKVGVAENDDSAVTTTTDQPEMAVKTGNEDHGDRESTAFEDANSFTGADGLEKEEPQKETSVLEKESEQKKQESSDGVDSTKNLDTDVQEASSIKSEQNREDTVKSEAEEEEKEEEEGFATHKDDIKTDNSKAEKLEDENTENEEVKANDKEKADGEAKGKKQQEATTEQDSFKKGHIGTNRLAGQSQSKELPEVRVSETVDNEETNSLKEVPPIPIRPEDQLEQEESKIEQQLQNFNSPPLPPRDTHTNLSENLLRTSSSSSVSSPPLPPRHTPKVIKNSVPPTLEQEMQNETFRKHVALTHAQAQAPRPPPRHKPKQLDTAAEINLIANRLRESSQHYLNEDEVVKENLKEGQNVLKMYYTNLLEKTYKENDKSIKEEEKREGEQEEGEITTGADAESKELFSINWAVWTQVVNDFPNFVNREPEKLEAEVANGIPPQIRGIIWQLIANSKSKEIEDIYETLQTTESPHEASIRRDLKRTNFIPEDKVEQLFNVIKVYSIYDPDVGYTQGMAFIVTPLLLNCESEADAFGLLISLMKNYKLRELFLPNMPGLMLMLYQFDRLLEENSPAVYNHLLRQSIRSNMYATQWFLTFFGYKFPFGFVLRIFDIVFIEGIEAILKFAVILVLKNEKKLLKLKFDQLLDFLKNELFLYYSHDYQEDTEDTESVLKLSLSKTISSSKNHKIVAEEYDIDAFVHDAINEVHITPITLKRYMAEYEEIHRAEQEKEEQYEHMRIKNHQLQKEVRKLEHDYTVLNREHVTIANELIKNRLKIETMADENHDLKHNILELQKQLDQEIRKQNMANPDASLPSDLAQDLKKAMERNMEVMEENMKLQDRIAELERALATQQTTKSATTTTTPQSPSNGWSGFKKVFK